MKNKKLIILLSLMLFSYSCAGAGDALSFARNNSGTKSDVLSLDRDATTIIHGNINFKEDAIAAFFISLLIETISAEPAVSALTCSINLFFLINFEH